MRLWLLKQVYDVTEMPDNLRIFKTKEAAEKFIQDNYIKDGYTGYVREDFEIELLPFNDE